MGTAESASPEVLVGGGAVAGLAAAERFPEFGTVTLYERQSYDAKRVNCGEAINDASLVPLAPTPENGFPNDVDGFDGRVYRDARRDPGGRPAGDRDGPMRPRLRRRPGPRRAPVGGATGCGGRDGPRRRGADDDRVPRTLRGVRPRRRRDRPALADLAGVRPRPRVHGRHGGPERRRRGELRRLRVPAADTLRGVHRLRLGLPEVGDADTDTWEYD